jgi:predicted RecB family nuclease
MKVTATLFEAYLKCPTKCYLQSHGESGPSNTHAEWLRVQSESYRSKGIRRLTTSLTPDECMSGVLDPEKLAAAKWRLAHDFEAGTQDLESIIHAVERVPPTGRGQLSRFIPIRFIFKNKLTRDDKLLLAFDALVLAERLGSEVNLGKIIHGDNYAPFRVKTSTLAKQTRKVTENIRTFVSGNSPPDLILNRHCSECEFQAQCRQSAIRTDDLSLLANLTASERKQLNSKGIFTVTQLSYTFRPRRRPKHLREQREKYHHSLKALAIRERKIHIVGSPKLNIRGTPIFLDVESVPDQDFYYLIGVRIFKNDSSVQHSLWADTQQDERKIWTEFLQVLAGVEDPVLIHYGSFEAKFIKLMRERHPETAASDVRLDRVLKESVNLLEFIYGQVYFPTYSNGLKEIAGFLGFNWPDRDATGAYSVIWRHQWEESMTPRLEQKLRTYNSADCEALEFVVKVLWRLPSPEESKKLHQAGNIAFVTPTLSNAFSHPSWQKFEGAMPELDEINEAAQWDYQRDRIYLRTRKHLKESEAQKGQAEVNPFRRVEKVISFPERPVCPKCLRKSRNRSDKVSYLLQELVFGKSSVKKRTIRHDFQKFRCRSCKTRFGLDERFHGNTKFGWNLTALYFYLAVELGIQQRTVARMFNRLFGVHISTGGGAHLKKRIAGYYGETVQKVMERITAGHLVQADETRARKSAASGYVWVFTNSHEVVCQYSESREADTLHKVMREFQGVLVSDFYAAYDSIECQQQKCLIHLLRDLNNEVLAQPYDEELKELVHNFASILKPMIETIDRYGLKRRFLNKHVKSVNRFYKDLSRREYRSEAAVRCKRRFETGGERLFTFLRHDGVPWNNNNAEHAIKAYARARELFQWTPTAKAISEYLVLLSVCETCRNKRIDFLDFLRSGEKDIEAFAASKGRKQQNKHGR